MLVEILTAAGVVVAMVASYYTYRTFMVSKPGRTRFSRILTIYESRSELLYALQEQYDAAKPTSTIWGQCVSCGDYSEGMTKAVVEGAARGLKFRLIINKGAPAAQEMVTIFSAIRTASLRVRSDNEFSVQGLDDTEAIVSIRTAHSAIAFRIRHPGSVRAFRRDFEARFLSSESVDVIQPTPQE